MEIFEEILEVVHCFQIFEVVFHLEFFRDFLDDIKYNVFYLATCHQTVLLSGLPFCLLIKQVNDQTNNMPVKLLP